MDRILYRIVPRDGLLVPVPTGGDLPAAGLVVPAVDLYWRRREADGDVTITAEQEAITPAPDAEAATDPAAAPAEPSAKIKRTKE